MRLFKIIIPLAVCMVLLSCTQTPRDDQPTTDDGTRLVLSSEDLSSGTWHTRHTEIFGKYVDGYNRVILQGVDRVQAHADSGGGYFIGLKAEPPESPVGYPLQLLGRPLLDPPRTTSYCSGSSFAAFMEGMNILLKGQDRKLDDRHFEALRMQEMDGGRREDHVKFWGEWNADGYGNHFALVQYTGMGKRIKPIQARPGDFMNISWNHGGGHSVIFLGWSLGQDSTKQVAFWSSQKSTNGFGDKVVPISSIREVMVVRLQDPGRLFTFDPQAPVDSGIKGDPIEW